MTVTTRPAAAGDIPQPSTSSSTMRNSAATSPPDRNSSPRLAPTCGRPAGVAGRAHANRAARRAGRAQAAPGAGRSTPSRASAVRMPPTAGPSARRGRRRPPRCARAAGVAALDLGRRSSADATTSAPPAAWTQRAADEQARTSGASPHASDAAAKTSDPATNARQGCAGRHTPPARPRARARGCTTSAPTRPW